MTPFAIALFCAAYIFGLLLTGLAGEVAGLPVAAVASLSLGAIAAVTLPRFWRAAPFDKLRSRDWLIAGLIGCLAVWHFQVRTPQPNATDISRQFDTNFAIVQVQGEIDSTPRLTRSQKIQFWLKANQATAGDRSEPVTGRLYVTLPLLQGTGLYPNQTIAVTGFLYDPKPATNPGGFNFQAYLRQEGGFAGLSGRSIEILNPQAPPILWSIRQRILRSQVQGLGVPAGVLVSAMVMGRNGIDLPFGVQDEFSRAGLAHALAASGFQVSLLISIILILTRKLPSQASWSLGTAIVLAYVGLTGLQPAVLRAAIMGLAALFALTGDRKIRPIASLLVAATVLLLWNPLWIWNLGFQFSFMATLGLLLTAQPLSDRLDWLPAGIASTAAVSIAAYLWTLPLQLYVFGTVSPYSILINILATPLIIVVSIGGMICSLVALCSPAIGAWVSLVLLYPTQALLQLVALVDRLPGNLYAIGAASAFQVVMLYLLWAGLSWRLSKSGRSAPRLLQATAVLSFCLIALPAWYDRAHLTQISVLATEGMPVVIVQTPRQVILINSGSETEVRYTLQPFLRQAGINHIDRAIGLDDRSNWEALRDNSIETRYQVGRAIEARLLGAGQTLTIDPLRFQLISAVPPILEMQLQNQRWLLFGAKGQIPTDLPRADVVWWSGENQPSLFRSVQPQVAIAPEIDPDIATRLQRQNVTTFATDEQGAIAWTPEHGFSALLQDESGDS